MRPLRPTQIVRARREAAHSTGTADSAVHDEAGNGAAYGATPGWEYERPPAVSGTTRYRLPPTRRCRENVDRPVHRNTADVRSVPDEALRHRHQLKFLSAPWREPPRYG